ncbi:MAG: hypothetical protein PHO56_04475 [Patescibacteria group bacterium]|nr:hypothetical protein [Patescibacteria group bacterium]
MVPIFITAISSLFRKNENSDCVFWQDGKIVFGLGIAKNISLLIYDLSGREKKSINGYYPSGQNRQNVVLPIGIYILKFNGAIRRLRIM